VTPEKNPRRFYDLPWTSDEHPMGKRVVLPPEPDEDDRPTWPVIHVDVEPPDTRRTTQDFLIGCAIACVIGMLVTVLLSCAPEKPPAPPELVCQPDSYETRCL
jgi:hypothetical protein